MPKTFIFNYNNREFSTNAFSLEKARNKFFKFFKFLKLEKTITIDDGYSLIVLNTINKEIMSVVVKVAREDF